MSVAALSEISELPCNWRKLNGWVSSSNKGRGATPTFEELSETRPPTVFCDKPAVFIRKPKIKLTEMREWITRRSGKSFQAYGRFRVGEYEIECVGAAFRFEKIEDAVLFKLFWA